MSWLVDIASWILMLVGGFFCLTAGLGLIRLPDFFSRTHAASVAESFGAVLILSGLMLQSGWTLITAKLFLIVILLVLTAPPTAHALARAALHSGMRAEPDQPDRETPPSSS